MRRRSQRIMNKSPQPESDEDEADKGSARNAPEVKPPPKKRKKKIKPTEDDNSSSSESDIGEYLQPADKIDLNSSFFEVKTTQGTSGSSNKEASLSAQWTRLSDSDSEPEDKNEVQVNQVTPCNNVKDSEEPSCSQIESSNKVAKLNFQQLQQFTTKIEEAKKHVEAYKARKSQLQDVKVEENNEDIDISDLLAIGEKAIPGSSLESISRSLHDSDFESLSDSEREDWEEIKIKDHDTKGKSERIKDGVQITVELPGGTIRKKKQVDLMAAVKRRLNRMRKENQVYVHKVHLLCWIAHGNFVNNVLNDVKILSSALSLLPSQKCYPSGRADLSYLEQLLQWFKKAVSLNEKPLPKNKQLVDLLVEQIEKKQAFNKRMLVYIFVALLRSLGLQCRLVLSFQVEPLRPPSSDLHSLKTKQEEATNTKTKKKTENESGKNESKSKSSEVMKNTKPKKTETESKLLKSNENKTRSFETAKKDIINDKDVSRKSKNVEARNQKSINLKKLKEASRNSVSNKPTELKENKTSKTRVSKIESNSEKLQTDNSEKSNLKSSVEKVESEKSGKLLRRSTRTKDENSDKNKKSENKSKTLEGEESTNSKKKTSTKNTKHIAQVDGFNDSDSEHFSFPKTYLDTSQITSFRFITPLWENSVYNRCTIPQLDGADDKISNSTKPKAAMPKIDLAKLKKTGKKADTSKQNEKSSLQNKANKELKSLPSKKVVEKSNKDTNKVVKKPEFSPEPFRGFTNSGIDIRSDIIQIMKSRISEEKVKEKKRVVGRQKHKPVDVDDDDDSDYVPESTKKKVHDSEDEFVPKTKVKRRIPVKRSDSSRKVLSSDDETEKNKKKKGVDVWAEVFLEAEEKWISVDVVRGEVHCVQQLFNRATHPVSYIVAWNNDNSLKDVTVRYCNNFNTVTRKLRVDKKWWDETLKPFSGKKTARDREEDEELTRLQLEKPLPTSIAEYKNHPLYALRRHLLKFEGIYPPDAATLGFVRGEPVYARDCVYTLHSREIWLKSAKVVKPGEKPYKIVKARPKYDRLSNTMISDQMLELFGPWQTEDYVPPTAENGVVPRNAYGNVELFKPCMLPKKTVHLRLPGLNKIARKLNIDCASAIVGFDFHSGWSHPTYDGFVVCEEYADQLIAAWELEQEEIERRESEKIEKRVYDNWRKLIKGLLIRERLQAKYEFGDSSGKKEKKKRRTEPLKSPEKKKPRKITSDSSDSDFVC